ncbi:sigma-70 family RNA polymerase sigma factor [Nocardioides sp. 503]|uniref:RNA polymerase sigma factor n=1 Tax=Nocardioides sp. 503 TaxID=2508326 RepID=UPI00142F6198|nr:sigma-70 family RNA polymerase sigma factor [Nocardioides sp. 503]
MSDREARLAAVYDECAPRVHAYAVRHCGPDEADDVLAETFAVAWRRLDDVPDPAIGWLIVTARHVIAGRRRTARRREELDRHYAEQPEIARLASEPGADEVVVRRATVLQALDTLSEREREALLLTAWDGLGHADAAAVARCSTRAFRARLMRARARLTAALLQAETSTTRTTVLNPTERTPT